MIIHASMLPVLLVTALLGAGYVAYRYTRMSRPAALGALVGALAGAAGPFIFMLPLQSCTFEPERERIDFLFGIFLCTVGALLVVIAASWLSEVVLKRGNRVVAPTQGTFNMPFIVPLLLLAPTLVILALFIYYPAVETFRLSTMLVRLGAPRTRFMCVNNFTELIDPQFSPLFYGLLLASIGLFGVMVYMRRAELTLTDNFKWVTRLFSLTAAGVVYLFLIEFWNTGYSKVFFNTIFISGMIVVLGLIISLAIAYLAFQPVKGASIYRTLLIWPYAISPPIAGILFFVMFDPTAGIVDHLLTSVFGLNLPNYRNDAWLARWVVIMASVWKTLGYNILFYIAGLPNVPKELIEAAAIDGANAWQRFMNVVVPSLSPITFFLIITNLTYAFFDTYGTIDYLTKGAPAGATSVAIYEIIRVGVSNKDLGRGAAQSIILFVMVIAVTLWQFRTSGRRVTYGA